jgi:carboxylesterase
VIPDLFSPLAAPFRLEGSNGEAVVLTHGFTGIPGHFRPLAESLNAEGFTVSAPLLPGHGTTIEDLGRVTADDWIDTVRNSARAVQDHRRVHLGGLSMGGLLSLIVASRVGAASVTTIDSPVITRDKKLYASRLAHRFVPRVEWPEEEPPPLDDDVRELWLTYRGFEVRSAAELVSVMRRGYLAARRLRRPSLVIQSKADETVDPRSGTLLARALGPSCRLVWLQSSIHNALLDSERDVIHRAVLDRISSL